MLELGSCESVSLGTELGIALADTLGIDEGSTLFEGRRLGPSVGSALLDGSPLGISLGWPLKLGTAVGTKLG